MYYPVSCTDSDSSLLTTLDRYIWEVKTLAGYIAVCGDLNVHNHNWLVSNKKLEQVKILRKYELRTSENLHSKKNVDLCISDFVGNVDVGLREPLGKSDHAIAVLDLSVPLHWELSAVRGLEVSRRELGSHESRFTPY